jgi:hypothetical protein
MFGIKVNIGIGNGLALMFRLGEENLERLHAIRWDGNTNV